MSGPVSDWLRESADRLNDLADYFEDEADAMLADDSAANDLLAADFAEQAAQHRVDAGVADAAADVVDWLGF